MLCIFAERLLYRGSAKNIDVCHLCLVRRRRAIRRPALPTVIALPAAAALSPIIALPAAPVCLLLPPPPDVSNVFICTRSMAATREHACLLATRHIMTTVADIKLQLIRCRPRLPARFHVAATRAESLHGRCMGTWIRQHHSGIFRCVSIFSSGSHQTLERLLSSPSHRLRHTVCHPSVVSSVCPGE